MLNSTTVSPSNPTPFDSCSYTLLTKNSVVGQMGNCSHSSPMPESFLLKTSGKNLTSCLKESYEQEEEREPRIEKEKRHVSFAMNTVFERIPSSNGERYIAGNETVDKPWAMETFTTLLIGCFMAITLTAIALLVLQYGAALLFLEKVAMILVLFSASVKAIEYGATQGEWHFDPEVGMVG